MFAKTRAVAQKYGSKAAGLALTLPAAAYAQTADPFDATVAAITTKITSYGGSLVVLSGVAVAFYVAIKFVKKIPKAG